MIILIFLLAAMTASCATSSEPPYFAQGVKIGEVTAVSAIAHVRLTAKPERNTDPGNWQDTGKETRRGQDLGLVGECPGAPGQVRILYGVDSTQADANITPWVSVDSTTDFTHQFIIEDLKPSSVYFYQPEATGMQGGKRRAGKIGRFTTAPLQNEWSNVKFTVITGQSTRTRDREDGFNTYVSMKEYQPNFLIPTGDNVYYDGDPPFATTHRLARFHWHRMYSLPTIKDFFLTSAVYFEKDDHDYRWNDSDPYRDFPGISHEDGIAIYREQVPMSEKPYRTFRWGKGLQIWVVEGRDFRSQNDLPDGPDKSIWGKEQKAWLKETIRKSDAIFKVLVSPTPIIGPDRQTKRDNHANRNGFWTEGREFLQWIKDNASENFFICCGDRHWQYHSIDKTGVMEFSSGPVTDKHASGLKPTPGSAPRSSKDVQPWHRIAGGFLSVEVTKRNDKPIIIFQFHDVYGKVLYEWSKTEE